MPKILSRALTDERIRKALQTPRGPVPLKLTDGAGLRLVRYPTRTSWELRVQRDGKDVAVRLGDWPKVNTVEARRLAEETRVAYRAEPHKITGATWKKTWDGWLAIKKAELRPGYYEDVKARVEKNVPPDWGPRPVREISRREVVEVLERISARGARVQAMRVRSILESAFDYAVARGDLDDNPSPAALLKVLPKPERKKNHAAAPASALSAIWGALEQYPGAVSLAMRFVILTAARTTEVRLATWEEIDMEAAQWVIPGERMKSKRPHTVPLSEPALAVLRAAKMLKQPGCSLVFPTVRACRPLSDNAMLYALKGMGFDFTVHGFRATFSTWANDTRAADPDVIEAALAHIVPGVKGVYDRGDRLAARRALMSQWARMFITAGP